MTKIYRIEELYVLAHDENWELSSGEIEHLEALERHPEIRYELDNTEIRTMKILRIGNALISSVIDQNKNTLRSYVHYESKN